MEGTESASPLPKKGRGRPRKMEKNTVVGEKKQRGRPKKIVTESDSSDMSKNKKTVTTDGEEKGPQKRGRPRKSDSTDNVNTINGASAGSSLSKKKGRPKKSAENKRKPGKPGKRGRPKKTVGGDASAAANKKSGRSKKNVVADSEASEDMDASTDSPQSAIQSDDNMIQDGGDDYIGSDNDEED